MNTSELQADYHSYLRNDSIKYAIFMEEEIARILEFEANVRSSHLKERLLVVQLGIGTFLNHFLFQLLEEVMQGLITGGIAQRTWEFYKEIYLTLPSIPPKAPKILTLEDLNFGFFIWLAACGISSLVFFCEILVKIYEILKVKVKQLIGVFLFMRILKNLLRETRG